MYSIKTRIILVSILVIVGITLFLLPRKEIKEVILGNKTFFVEVAQKRTELERGLSLHVPLLDNQGMLFVFSSEDFYKIWMKDMTFSLDILWIDSNLKINHIEKNVSPDTYPKLFFSEEKSLYVLEISAGQADLLQIKVGDKVGFVKK